MNSLVLLYHKLGSPPHFFRISGRLIPWMYGAFIVLTAVGLWGGLVLAPPDYQQLDSFRIIYVHVPAAWMALFIYVFMAVCAAIALIWRIKLSELMAMASAPIGAAFALITLITGSLWGKPMWGTYWIWDARLTSMLVLLFLYLGVIALYNAIEDPRRAAKAAGLLAIVGVVNVPIVRYSVEWWNTLHQGPSIQVFARESTIDGSMLWPLLVMAVATKFYFVASLLVRTRVLLLRLEGSKAWVREALGERRPD